MTDARAQILLVEDNDSTRLVVAELLEDAGHRVLAVGTAAEALAAVEARAEPIDIVLTDVSLPDGRGPQLVARIREQLPTIPVIYVSGHDAGDIERGPNDGYLIKPIDIDELVALVDAWLRRATEQGS